MKTALVIVFSVTFLSACSDSHYQIAAAGGDQTHVYRVDTRSGEVTLCVFAPKGMVCVRSPAELSQLMNNPPGSWKDGVPYVAPVNP